MYHSRLLDYRGPEGQEAKSILQEIRSFSANELLSSSSCEKSRLDASHQSSVEHEEIYLLDDDDDDEEEDDDVGGSHGNS